MNWNYHSGWFPTQTWPQMTSIVISGVKWKSETWKSDSWQTKIKQYEERTKEMEELEAKKRAKERLKKATMHREGQGSTNQDVVSRLVPIDQCRRTTVRRHGPWIPETEIDGMSKLRGKLQIVISKIKYYWIIVSEIILRRLKQGKVLSV